MSGACPHPPPRARQVPKRAARAPPLLQTGAQPGSLWHLAGCDSGRLSRGRARVCRAGIGRGSSGLQGASGWLTFLPLFLRRHLTPLTEAGGVNRGGSCQGPRCGPKESQGQSAVSTLARVCRGPGSHRARILCWSNQGLTERPPGLGSEARVSSCVDPVPVTSSSLDPVHPVCQMGDSNMCDSSLPGGRQSQEKEFKDELFPGNFYPLPSKTPAFVPKEGGQRGQQVVCESSPHHFTHPSNQTPFPLQPHFRNFSKEKSSQSHQEMVLLLAILVQRSCN